MPRKPRPLPNNAKACVEDIIAIVKGVAPEVAAASELVEKRYMDPVLLADLVHITRALHVIDISARNALQNRYEPGRLE